MALVIAPESVLGQELAKWDAPKREGGERCNGFEPYPMVVYRADRYTNGKVMCGHPLAGTGDEAAEAFARRCWRKVNSADEHAQAAREGWSDTPAEAVDVFEAAAKAEADAAANAAYHAARMSEKAQQEFAAAQEAAEFHAADGPAAPKLPAVRSHHKKKPVAPTT
jgi:hypothetical protein